jgi:hypothetical protein
MIHILLLSAAWAAKPNVLSVVVTDASGAPVPTGSVLFDAEGERHRVNTLDGSFASTLLYLADGSELDFATGATTRFWVTASGYAGARVEHVMVGKKKDDRVVVVLEPLEVPSLVCVAGPLVGGQGRATAEAARVSLQSGVGEEARGCAMAAIAWGYALDLQADEVAYAATPSDELLGAIVAGRKDTLAAIRAWREWLAAAGQDPTRADPLCVSVAGTDAPCR